jgi:hypothetical protein
LAVPAAVAAKAAQAATASPVARTPGAPSQYQSNPPISLENIMSIFVREQFRESLMAIFFMTHYFPARFSLASIGGLKGRGDKGMRQDHPPVESFALRALDRTDGIPRPREFEFGNKFLEHLQRIMNLTTCFHHIRHITPHNAEQLPRSLQAGWGALVRIIQSSGIMNPVFFVGPGINIQDDQDDLRKHYISHHLRSFNSENKLGRSNWVNHAWTSVF